MSLERSNGVQLAAVEAHRERQRSPAASRPRATTWSRSAALMIDKFPKLRKLTHQHHRADAAPRHPDADQGRRDVPRAQRDLLDARLDRRRRRHARRGAQREATASRRPARPSRAMQELQKTYRFNFGISSTIFSKNLDDAENILAWAKKEKLDIVFNMVRFTDADAGQRELEGTSSRSAPKKQTHAPVLPRSRPPGSAARRPELHLHALRRHDRQRLSPRWRRARSRRRASCSTRTATCSSARTATSSATSSTEDPRSDLLPRHEPAAPRVHPRREVPDLPQPLPDERRGDEAGGALREVPGARVDGEAPAFARCSGGAAPGRCRRSTHADLIAAEH